MRLRFAPSPTGQLHVGNARTALFNWLLARGQGGTFVLRIEDTDAERSTRLSEQAIFEDLRWLGLEWDEGPDCGGPYGPYRQSERLPTYRAHATRLLQQGDAYACFCTPDELAREREAALAAGDAPRYSGRCRALTREAAEARMARGEAAALRFRVPDIDAVAFDDVVRGHVVFKREQLGDFVIVRSDGMPAYNFAVVVDDMLMRITDVVRGEDHVSNTPRQLLVYRALGAEPPAFAHLSLVMGPDHTPLSKRHGATSVAEFRARGYLPEALVNQLALIGWSPGHDEELLPPTELARRFRLQDVGKAAGVFDPDKLAWLNRQYLKQLTPERLTALVVPYFERVGWAVSPDGDGRAYLGAVAAAGRADVDRLEEIPQRFACVFVFDVVAAMADESVGRTFDDESARRVVLALADELDKAAPLDDRERFRAAVARVKERTGLKGRQLFHPIRVALTGREAGPELDVLVPLIDRGAQLAPRAGVQPILACRARAKAFAAIAAARR